MSSAARFWIAVGALLGAIGVGLGAYGAHGLSEFLGRLGYEGDDLHHRVAIFETAVRYQMMHAIALVLTGLLLNHRDCKCWHLAACSFLAGVLIFSGLLKVLTFAGPSWRWLGAIVPIGGVLLIVGWVAMAVGAIRR
jgi:uncharacterized membrane protein YgdD (TMEM256/DUF423 family)